ncbi:MAG: ATP-binding protein [Chitinophagaceae bacterium]|nr:ATP-binding protein [Chitinophagaceae bacterium]
MDNNFHVEQYTTENGLPSNGVKGLQWDEATGFLWIATEAGIVRFNGVEFRAFTKENTPTIGSERMLFMTRNFKGAICISDLVGNIFKVAKSKPLLWKQATANTNPYYDNYYLLSVSDTFFNAHFEDKNKAVGFSAVTDKVLSINDTACLILNRGLLSYQHIAFNNPFPLPSLQSNFSTLFKIEDQFCAVDKKNNFFYINPITQKQSPVNVIDEMGNIFKTDISNASLFWEQGMQNPIYIKNGKAWELTQKDNNIIAKLIFTNIPADAFIKSIQYSKKNKLLFIGTDSKGLIVLHQNSVESKRRLDANSKNRNSYYAQFEVDNGNILTNEGDVIGNNKLNPETLPIQGKFAFHITYTTNSLLWYYPLRTKYGYPCMFNYNIATKETKEFPDIKTESLLTVSGNNTWLANSKGIFKLSDTGFQEVYKQATEAAGNLVFSFTEIKPGILALASCNGLFSFSTKNLKLDTIFSLKDYCVRTIWKYKDYVFFGTYGAGFYVYKNGIVHQMPLDKNNYLLYTHCFINDEKGFCWISTNRGLFKASLVERIKAADNNSASVYYHYFGKKDGMEMTELNGGCSPCALQLKNNTISFPSMDGLLWVNPDKATPILPEGEIFIDEVVVDKTVINPEIFSQNALLTNTSNIIFRLAYSAWCNKENIYLSYKLNEAETWQTVDTKNESEISFSNLSPGKYTLQLRKMNGFGENNFSYKTIDFTIATPWYKQWWFYFAIAASIFGLFMLFYKIRTRNLYKRQLKLEKQVAEKTEELQQKNDVLEKSNNINTRLISIISHDIITPLKFLNVAGKNLIEKKDLMSEDLKDETIKEITTTSKELQLLSTNILNWIKYQNENRRLVKEQFYLSETVNQVFGILNSMAHQKKLLLINTVADDLQVTEYHEALRILIYNLITNAINFSDKGSIIVEANKQSQHISICVKDEGVGMTNEQIKNIMADQFIISSANIDNKKGNGLGYLIIKDLVKMMGAKLTITSAKGSGTTVVIDIINA